MKKQMRTPMMPILMLGLLFVLGGCSTPTPPEYAEGTLYSEAMNSYSLCQSRMYPVDGGTSCDLRSPSQMQPSYGEYSRANQGWQYNYYSKPSAEESLEQYFDTLSVDEIERLNQDWHSLAEQY